MPEETRACDNCRHEQPLAQGNFCSSCGYAMPPQPLEGVEARPALSSAGNGLGDRQAEVEPELEPVVATEVKNSAPTSEELSVGEQTEPEPQPVLPGEVREEGGEVVGDELVGDGVGVVDFHKCLALLARQCSLMECHSSLSVS